MKPASKKSIARGRNPGSSRRGFFLFTISFPFIFFLLIELLLRVFNYGPDISLFRTETIAGRTYWIMNPQVKARYFSSVQFNPMTSMDYFPVPKSAGTYRIFCLGGSTTAGYPYGYIGSFSTFLKERLSRLFPDRTIEVINLGLTATNSFTTLDFAQDLMGFEPDLLIVYDGHNEFYGALGVASNESVGKARWLTRLYLSLVHSRVFLLLRDSYNNLLSLPPSSDMPQGGTMMERLARGQYIPYRSPLYESARSIFLENVSDLIDLCREHHVPLILSSQVSNIHNQSPFVSAGFHRTLSDSAKIYAAAVSRLDQGQPDSALAELLSLAPGDSLSAELHYNIGRCYDQLGIKPKARKEYTLARDYDQLRFRTSTDFNSALKRIAHEQGAIFVDLEEIFRSASPDSIIGNELILEHLHPNAYGYFLIAKAYAGAMRGNGLFADKSRWEMNDTVPDESLWQKRGLTELDERSALRRTEFLTASWPFSEQDRSVPQPRDTIGVIIDGLLDGRIAWEQAHVAAAEYYEREGDLMKAEKEYRALILMIPVNVSPYLRLGRLYMKEREAELARNIFEKSLNVEPTAYACRGLGTIAIDSGNPRKAIAYLERAVSLSGSTSDRIQSSYLLALAYGRAEMIKEAVSQLQSILRTQPGFKPAQELLRRLSAQK